MLKILLLLLALAALGLTVFYGIYYKSPIQGATYQDTYAILSLMAATIFSGLLFALYVNQEKSDNTILLDQN
jgi:hypothetical protein